jgi:hypothetical protein
MVGMGFPENGDWNLHNAITTPGCQAARRRHRAKPLKRLDLNFVKAQTAVTSLQREKSMAKFKVLCRVDAYIDYVAKVEADNAEEAAELAQDNASDYDWEERGPVQFDARGYVTLNAKGQEREATRRGYFG